MICNVSWSSIVRSKESSFLSWMRPSVKKLLFVASHVKKVSFRSHVLLGNIFCLFIQSSHLSSLCKDKVKTDKERVIVEEIQKDKDKDWKMNGEIHLTIWTHISIIESIVDNTLNELKCEFISSISFVDRKDRRPDKQTENK